ncbi:MAG: hypothetical protein IKO49_04030 [Bacilli bacterium]|nr:hypothetical protein [Bacilli bacterium]
MFKKTNYEEYNLYLNNNLFKLEFNNNEVPQGLCIIEEKVYITCYKTDNTNSCVIELNMNGKRLRTIDLKNKSHVGGIGYDKKHNLVFICDTKGRVTSYKYNSFTKVNSFDIASYQGSKLIENNKLVCSYLTCYSEKLYVGSFNRRKNGYVKVYDIKREKNGIELTYQSEFIVPKKTQGLDFYKYKDQQYIILSNSYGRKRNSNIQISRYNENDVDYSKNSFKMILPPMLEQIDINNNSLILLFESSAFKYKKHCNYVIDKLIGLDINKLIDDNKIL